ncbi:hypothetical protein Zmor_006260 [Zophobas morio]|uniref:Uncharacterized protein n=1 Tax=Zophobas morio TaxID=2755281 RepID=A0AA38MND8_9CUCU|nr:hypothetical protein Zmor_006260 [Zophobas morio]
MSGWKENCMSGNFFLAAAKYLLLQYTAFFLFQNSLDSPIAQLDRLGRIFEDDKFRFEESSVLMSDRRIFFRPPPFSPRRHVGRRACYVPQEMPVKCGKPSQ